MNYTMSQAEGTGSGRSSYLSALDRGSEAPLMVNPVDFNQFRDLIVNRLKRSDVKELNEFAELYEERSTGSYKSEEFMVDLGAKIGAGEIQFSPTFLQELKASPL